MNMLYDLARVTRVEGSTPRIGMGIPNGWPVYDEAASRATTAPQMQQHRLGIAIAADALGGRPERAREMLAHMKSEPGTSISTIRKSYLRRVRPQAFQIQTDGLRKAGFPERPSAASTCAGHLAGWRRANEVSSFPSERGCTTDQVAGRFGNAAISAESHMRSELS